jgi:hypothetical protein
VWMKGWLKSSVQGLVAFQVTCEFGTTPDRVVLLLSPRKRSESVVIDWQEAVASNREQRRVIPAHLWPAGPVQVAALVFVGSEMGVLQALSRRQS